MALKLQVVRTPQCSQLLQGKPVAPSGPSCELTPCRKAPKPAGRAAAAPPSLRGRGSPARRASPEGCRARGRPPASPSCRPPRSGDSRQPEAGGRRCGERLRGSGRWGGSRQHRGRQGQPAGNFPPTVELVQDPYCRRSRSGRRRCRRRCPFLPFPVFWGASGDGEDPGKRRPSSGMGSRHNSGAQPVPLPSRRQPGSFCARCHFANLSPSPGLRP